MKKLKLLMLAFCMTIANLFAVGDPTENFIVGTPEIKSLSTLTFGPEGILFIGDSKGGNIFAIATDDKAENKAQDKLEIADIESKIADLLGAKNSDILIHDMAVNPISQNVYLSVSRGRSKGDSPWKLPNDWADANILLKISKDGKISEVPLSNIKYSQIALPNPVTASAKEYWRGDIRVDAITDIAYYEGKVFVAGLSNEEFSSSFRIIPFPFNNKVLASSIEIYHAAHGKFETDSPIRTFLPLQINNVPTLLAVHTCTPLVTIPLADLKDKTQAKGRTIAELGGGNMPLDIISYKKEDKEYVLISNTGRNLMKIDAANIQKADKAITEQVKERYATAGVPYISVPMVVQQLDKLNDTFALMLLRLPNGTLSLNCWKF